MSKSVGSPYQFLSSPVASPSVWDLDYVVHFAMTEGDWGRWRQDNLARTVWWRTDDSACPEWATAEEAWLHTTDTRAMVATASALVADRTSVMRAVVAYASEAIPAWEKTFPGDTSVREAIEIARQWPDELDAATMARAKVTLNTILVTYFGDSFGERHDIVGLARSAMRLLLIADGQPWRNQWSSATFATAFWSIAHDAASTILGSERLALRESEESTAVLGQFLEILRREVPWSVVLEGFGHHRQRLADMLAAQRT